MKISFKIKILSVFIIITLLLTSCATPINYTYEESCALKGLVLSGVTSTNLNGSNYNINTGNTSVNNLSGESIQCKIAQNENEKCLINELRKKMIPKVDYNENISTYRTITGVGYCLFIVPGIIFKIIFDDKKNNAIIESNKISVDCLK